MTVFDEWDRGTQESLLRHLDSNYDKNTKERKVQTIQTSLRAEESRLTEETNQSNPNS